MTAEPAVCAMTVTYGDRASLCGRVVERLVEIGVSQVIVVDNASSRESRSALEDLAARLPQVTVIRNEDNLGSSGGFATALEAAFGTDNEFLFLLDDDNVPHADCLAALFAAHRLLDADSGHGTLLYANRSGTRPADTLAFERGLTKFYPRNSFCGFSIFRQVGVRLQRLTGTPRGTTPNYPVVRVRYGPYGGMFGRREVFAEAGLPCSDFYLYADDHEYATRMDERGVSQFLVHSARIDDIDVSLRAGSTVLSPEFSTFRLYYQFRNHTHLSQRFVRSRRAYAANKFFFIAWTTAKAWRAWRADPKGTLQRWRLLLDAVGDGEAARLGRTFVGRE